MTIEEVVMKYSTMLYRICVVMLGNEADAQDAVQDTLCKYLERTGGFTDQEHEKAWLIRVTINRAKDIRSSFWRRNQVDWEDTMASLPFEEPADSRLFEAVMGLDEKYRIVVHMYYYEDYDIREIAGILHCPSGTIRSRMSRARALLKSKLKEEWKDD